MIYSFTRMPQSLTFSRIDAFSYPQWALLLVRVRGTLVWEECLYMKTPSVTSTAQKSLQSSVRPWDHTDLCWNHGSSALTLREGHHEQNITRTWLLSFRLRHSTVAPWRWVWGEIRRWACRVWFWTPNTNVQEAEREVRMAIKRHRVLSWGNKWYLLVPAARSTLWLWQVDGQWPQKWCFVRSGMGGGVLEHRYSSHGLLSAEGAHCAFLLPPGMMRAMPLIFILTWFWLTLPMCIILSSMNKRNSSSRCLSSWRRMGRPCVLLSARTGLNIPTLALTFSRYRNEVEVRL